MHNLRLEEVYLLIGELYVMKAIEKMRADTAEAKLQELESKNVKLEQPAADDPIRRIPRRDEVTGR